MVKQIQLTIPKPCLEKKWTKMSSSIQGNPCELCSKNVFDFSSWSDERILTFLEKS